jgi:hypothetical protein
VAPQRRIILAQFHAGRVVATIFCCQIHVRAFSAPHLHDLTWSLLSHLTFLLYSSFYLQQPSIAQMFVSSKLPHHKGCTSSMGQVFGSSPHLVKASAQDSGTNGE